jgi:hypothetical protein
MAGACRNSGRFPDRASRVSNYGVIAIDAKMMPRRVITECRLGVALDRASGRTKTAWDWIGRPRAFAWRRRSSITAGACNHLDGFRHQGPAARPTPSQPMRAQIRNIADDAARRRTPMVRGPQACPDRAITHGGWDRHCRLHRSVVTILATAALVVALERPRCRRCAAASQPDKAASQASTPDALDRRVPSAEAPVPGPLWPDTGRRSRTLGWARCGDRKESQRAQR